jgi:hypothetical protein
MQLAVEMVGRRRRGILSDWVGDLGRRAKPQQTLCDLFLVDEIQGAGDQVR